MTEKHADEIRDKLDQFDDLTGHRDNLRIARDQLESEVAAKYDSYPLLGVELIVPGTTANLKVNVGNALTCGPLREFLLTKVRTELQLTVEKINAL